MARLIYLLLQLARREISGRYKGATIGVLWSFFMPLLMLLVYTFVFSVVFQARWGAGSSDKISFALNLFAGMIVHGFFAECLARAPGLILQNPGFVKRVVFPLSLLVPSVTLSALFHAFISLLVLLLVHAFAYEYIYWQVLLLPFLMMPLCVFVVGIGWLVSAVGVFVRDVAQIVPVLITVLMFLSPVFYPVSALPEPYQQWMYLNPLTMPMEMMRGIVLKGELPAWDAYFLHVGISLATALCGLLVFRRLRGGFADVV